ncbi:Acetolactate synthase, catabolic [Pantoea agglomerans]|uniref:Acetolactate synthase, catabolic n=1 Tax=Enterobacter agglomerans TaxID=549 RepID=A0A379LSK3_ENTAG|nr:Acetolactate synthase, catabolic [Pantoea agglomerans]
MKTPTDTTLWTCGADLVVAQLEAQGVRHVFGIPGAKIDKVFDSTAGFLHPDHPGSPRS